MYQGNDASWTAKNRLFVGQVNKSSTTYVVTSYAIQGIYISPKTEVTTNTQYSFNDNIGVYEFVNIELLNRQSAGMAWSHTPLVAGNYGFSPVKNTKNSTIMDMPSSSAYPGNGEVLGSTTYALASCSYGEIKVKTRRSF